MYVGPQPAMITVKYVRALKSMHICQCIDVFEGSKGQGKILLFYRKDTACQSALGEGGVG